ncbi:hypothetical protein FSP39_015185 [Pinctada imbricata]|uniref:Uncharacterized protein n=1 Tax=Pinctada imbricata TaxID=66713 RepID=A0AA88XUF2_PINIB|nr:hypothetical protein FSP39_015185 [Pinctada imbricata]
MATSRKINECGWFYHAPAKRQSKEPIPVPVTSQIPGLNYELPYEEEPQKLLFKDTDTKYVRLAKQGGRQNLLQHKENPDYRQKPIVNYPRSEWFYLEDNALEDAQSKEKESPYQFMVPEYMVHDTFKPDDSGVYERPRRAPFSFDNKSAYERDGVNPTDKTVRLPEVIKPGYGVRSGKPIKTLKKPPLRAERARPLATAKEAQMDQERPKLKYLPLPESSDGTDRPKMTKLLSYTYDQEWHDNVRTWQYKQDRLRDKHRSMVAAQGPQDKEPLVSEYNTSFGKPKSSPYKPDRARRVVDPKTRSANSTHRETDKTVEKEPFKMSRFKNIPSKVDAEMPKAMQPIAAH